ncbi:Yip1 family protein [Pseudomonas sp. 30_B]|uniref:Yip1 family protein n=1 Tax=Pseudomonas sp. 30_B TaxID=2813575 RepID=UPI001A9E0A31|nr:Yip1 family protein [Pseudomonas sp. 30_B]
MNFPLLGFFVRPEQAWRDLRHGVDRHPQAFLPFWLLMPLIPAICLLIGTTQVGWRLPGDEDTQVLSLASGTLLAFWCYAGLVAGVVLIAYLVRWVLFRTESRPAVGFSMTFSTAAALPLMIAGLAALMPSRWLLILAAAAGSVYSAWLLYIGLPIYMRLSRRQTAFYGACILAFGFLALLTTAFGFLELWGQTMVGSGEYLQK